MELGTSAVITKSEAGTQRHPYTESFREHDWWQGLIFHRMDSLEFV